jgi:hypothetical protein
MRNIADVTGNKPIAVLLQSMSGVSAINPLVAFYDIHGGKREITPPSFILSRTPHETLINLNHFYLLLFFLHILTILPLPTLVEMKSRK